MENLIHGINVLLIPILAVFSATMAVRFIRHQAHQLPYRIKVILLIPGTTLHELSHAAVAGLAGMKVDSILAWSGNTHGELGHVSFRYRKDSPFHYLALPFVALAPLFCALMLWLAALQFGDTFMITIPPIDWFDPQHHALMTDLVAHQLTSIKSGPFEMAITVLVSLFLPYLWPSLQDWKIATKGMIAWLIIIVIGAIITDIMDAWLSTLLFLYEAQSVVMSVAFNFVLMTTVAAPFLFMLNISAKWLSRSRATRC